MFLYDDVGARLLTHLLTVKSFSRLHRLVVNFGRPYLLNEIRVNNICSSNHSLEAGKGEEIGKRDCPFTPPYISILNCVCYGLARD